MKYTTRMLAALAVSAGILFAPMRGSAEPSASDKETARALLIEGKAKMASKEYAAAHKKFRAAHDIMNVPTTGIELARAQEALGLLVEARDTALEVTRMVSVPDSKAFAQARAAAAELAARVLPRIASLVIRVAVPPGVGVEVKVDDSEVPRSALALPRKVNPGERVIIASATGYTTEKRVVTLKEGETLEVEIPLRAAPPDAPASTSPAAAATEKPTPDETSGGVPPWAWVSGSAGIAALGASIAFAVDFAHVKGELTDNCPENNCRKGFTPAEGEPLRERWNRDVGLMVAFGGVGLAGVGAGIAGIVMGPSGKEQSGKALPVVVVPWASRGGGGAALAGTF